MAWEGVRPRVRNLAAGSVLALLTGFGAPSPAQNTLDDALAKAHASLDRHDFASAEKQLRDLALQYPGSLVVHNDLGALYLQQQRYPQACRELTEAARLGPAVADVQRNLGTCYFLQDDYAAALAPLERARSLDDQDLRTRYQLGYSLLMLGHPERAEPELEYAAARMPGEEHVLFALVKLYQGRRDQEKAAAAFQKLQQAHPESVFVHILMGESYDIQEKTDEAIAEYEKAVSLAPGMPRLHFDLGFLYWEGQRFREAAAEMTREIKLNPGFTPAWYYLGDMALEQNQPSEAIRCFTAAIARSPGCVDAHVGLGKSYFRLNDMTRALAEFETANRIDGAQPDVHYWLSKVYRSLGKTDRRDQELKVFQSLKQKPADKPVDGQTGHERWASASCMPAPQARRPRP